MPVELSDEQYVQLTNAAKFLQEAAESPDTRREFERLAKKLRPTIQTTDDLAEQYAGPVREELQAVSKKFDEYLEQQRTRETESQQRAADEARDAAFGRLKSEGYTEEGIGRIKQMMVDRSIADPEAAAALYDRLNPKPVEGHSSWEPPSYDIRNNAVAVDVEGLFKDPDSWADKAIYDVLRDERSRGQ